MQNLYIRLVGAYTVASAFVKQHAKQVAALAFVIAASVTSAFATDPPPIALDGMTIDWNGYTSAVLTALTDPLNHIFTAGITVAAVFGIAGFVLRFARRPGKAIS